MPEIWYNTLLPTKGIEMSKKVSARFSFPATKCSFIYIVQPDTEFDDNGVYQISMSYDKETADSLKAKLEKLDPRLKGLIEYYEKDDGTCIFKAKQKRVISWTDKAGERQEAIMKPTVLNEDNSPFEGTTNPWGGTVAEVGVVVETQKGARGKGIIAALRLRGVRIHELIQGGAEGGDGDPLFGGAVANPRVEIDEDDLPFDADSDDMPI